MEKKLRLILKILKGIISILVIELDERIKENELSKHRLEESNEGHNFDSRSGYYNYSQE